jgi:hypothetical protein
VKKLVPNNPYLRMVRAMTPSLRTSNTWLNVFAAHEHSMVPTLVHPSRRRHKYVYDSTSVSTTVQV